MRSSSVARNYAEALFELGQKDGQLERYGELIERLGTTVAGAPGIQSVLMSPKITKALKSSVMASALGAIGAPRDFIRFVGAVIKRGRQNLWSEIAAAYGALLDRQLNRVRATVTLARSPDPEFEASLRASLTKMVGKEVLTVIHVDPDLLGGAVIRVEDRVYDGSLKRRLIRLRRALLAR